MAKPNQKDRALREFEMISSYEEAHAIIDKSIKFAGGNHSFFLSKSEQETYLSQQQAMPKVERRDTILYIYLPVIANAQKYGKEYVEIVLNGLKENSDVKGIILDLQANSGGDMGPMITAISPLLPDGEILYFSFNDYDTPVILKDGLVSGGGTPIETDIEPFKVEVPTAVLTSRMTASSGEATLMSLIELDNVKTFGQSSGGWATANAMFNLYDDAVMFLTVAYMKTINGQIFGDKPIPVDVKTKKSNEEATKWLEETFHN